MRKLRHLVGACMGNESFVEITAKTAQEQYLLRPDPIVNSLIAGVLARASNRYGVNLYGHAFLSNHFHLLIGVRSARDMKRFMNYLMGNVGRKINRYRGRSGPFWQRRYKHIEVSPDEESLAARLDYILQQGVKEGLVRTATDWPGLHCAHQFASGDWRVVGHWEDLSRKYRLEQAGKRVDLADVRSEEVVELQVLPCWANRDRDWVGAWVMARLEEHMSMQPEKVLGAMGVRQQDWRGAPRRSKRTYAPPFHCRDPVMRREWCSIYRDFVRAFYRAVAAQEMAEDEYGFPPGSFLPSGGFVEVAA